MYANVLPSKLTLSNHLCHTPPTGTSPKWLPLQVINRPVSRDYSERKRQRVVECDLKKAGNEIRAGNYLSPQNAVFFSALSQIFTVKEMKQTLDLRLYLCRSQFLLKRTGWNAPN